MLWLQLTDIRLLVRHLSVTWTAVRCSIPSASTSAGGVIEALGPTGQWLRAGPFVETKRRRGEVMAPPPRVDAASTLSTRDETFLTRTHPTTHPSPSPLPFPSLPLSVSRVPKLL